MAVYSADRRSTAGAAATRALPMVIIIPTPPRKPGDPPPPFGTQMAYALAFAAALFLVVGAAAVLNGARLY
ncbi:hypothetical protein [Phenylobacterium soli]|uniref:Uncharacterized protein n=1 Tax=Phenylobacterium soli TaxID=2170551 RepID=A0A328AHI2_9CAUL|nr:hypothetical protein [Phenylobacterium soli]RAK54262.1 hypothetical protein DJ017_06855 [Phenylobacterium soli]